MLRKFKADLHIHTSLSPCADEEMFPQSIIRQAKMNDLDIVGICDHNSAENVVATKKIGQREDIAVIGGIEATSQEEVHILALFENVKELFKFQEIIYEKLSGFNDEKIFGKQLIINENNEVVGSNNRLLIGATSLSLQEIVQAIYSLGGLTIASHIDRESYSIIAQLGFIPEGLLLDALELSPNYELKTVCVADRRVNPELYGFSLVTFSDAHFLKDIGKSFTVFLMEEASIGEIKKALSGEDGRKVMIG
ncbi:MAG: PHP domain-containing protein [Actinobacteria bacterium]|nr:PHP domain-containing protein [Actinomycetota bacterium]